MKIFSWKESDVSQMVISGRMFVDWTKRAIYVHANYKSTRMGDRERKIKRSPNPERPEINEKNHNVLCILIYIAVIFSSGLLLSDVHKAIANYFSMHHVKRLMNSYKHITSL